MLSWFLILILLLLIGPFYVLLTGNLDLQSHWTQASRESANIAPKPDQHPEAIAQIYAAKAHNWRGMFAIHSWIAVKKKDAKSYTVYEVMGWHAYRGNPALYVHDDIPDRLWFNNKPEILLDLRGQVAEDAINNIEKAVAAYPYADQYHTWPGPNSNTFVAYLIRHVPQLAIQLPTTAIGKDFLGWSKFYAIAPSHTGYQVSLFGALGITLAKQEGIEFNILGLNFGVGLQPLQLKVPGLD